MLIRLIQLNLYRNFSTLDTKRSRVKSRALGSIMRLSWKSRQGETHFPRGPFMSSDHRGVAIWRSASHESRHCLIWRSIWNSISPHLSFSCIRCPQRPFCLSCPFTECVCLNLEVCRGCLCSVRLFEARRPMIMGRKPVCGFRLG